MRDGGDAEPDRRAPRAGHGPVDRPDARVRSTTPSAPASQAATSDLKIGVVTDIGTLNDKNYNEYSFKGAQAGAAAIGAAEPKSIVPTSASEYAPSIKSFVDQGFDVIVTVGFNLGAATVQAAHDNQDTWFIGVDQCPICVNADGLPDSTFACAGDAKTLLPNYISVNFQEDQAGYLAGIVAAGATPRPTIGAIGGTSICAPCVRYIQGYELGAKSVKADIKVVTRLRHERLLDRPRSRTRPVARRSPRTSSPRTRTSTSCSRSRA